MYAYTEGCRGVTCDAYDVTQDVTEKYWMKKAHC